MLYGGQAEPQGFSFFTEVEISTIIMITLQMMASALVALLAVNWIFPHILKIAKVKGLVDNPDTRKLQKVPVPVLGGLAVVFGLFAGYMTFVALQGQVSFYVPQRLMPVLLGVSIMLYVGSLDDILGLTPLSRIVTEALVMLGLIYGSGICVDSLHGLFGVGDFTWWIGVPLTVFAGVGIINAYNMVDGVNGLSSGLSITCSCLLGVLSYKRCDYFNAALAFCFAASLVPFLLHNVFGKRSKMFIGDGGTMVMGLLVSWFIMCVLTSENEPTLTKLAEGNKVLGVVAMMVAIACVPVFDTLRVMTARMLRGTSPFHPDKTHLHHVFIAVGVSHSITALSEILINLIVVVIWFATYKAGLSVNAQFVAVIVSAVVLVWGMYFYLNRIVRHDINSWIRTFSLKTHLGHTHWWLALQKWLDKGAYEDYMVIMKEQLEKKTEDMTNKEKDIVAILNYLQGKKSVMVNDIKNESGADPMRVYPILYELEQKEMIEVLTREELGAAKSVRLYE